VPLRLLTALAFWWAFAAAAGGEDAAPARPGGLSALRYRSVDIMKFTKDEMRRQPSELTLARLLDCLKARLNLTHVAIAVPLDASSDYPAPKPGPATAEEFARRVCAAIHSRELKVLHRGTWCGIDGLYGFPKLTGAKRFPAGDAESVLKAAADGAPPPDSWVAKTYRYITEHPEFFADGDLWAVLPERTEGIFADASSFLPHTPPGIPQNYARFFNDLAAVSAEAFKKIGKKVAVGFTANNFSEVKSGWLPQSLFSAAGIVSFDHYGITHTPQELESDLRTVFAQRGKLPLFHQEWGDYWNARSPEPARCEYLKSMLNVWCALAAEGKLVGFNYWGGWQNEGEGILVLTGTAEDPVFELNARGKVLASYFNPAPAATPQP
jgi:hypothetical protein